MWKLLGYQKAFPKLPYASQLFGDTPAETLERANEARRQNFRAVKFGWGPIGRSDLKTDVDHFSAARQGLGKDGVLMVDVGQIFGHDVEAAAARILALEQFGALWLEEPFPTHALEAYSSLARRSRIKLAGGEGAHNFFMAQHLIDYGGVGYIQVDSGRIGGIGVAKRVADYAVERGVTFVNHTFTSHLALSASLQPCAGLRDELCEYPFSPKTLARELTGNRLERDRDGYISVPDAPGLGILVDPCAARRYLVDVQITVNHRVLFATSDQTTL